jgi:hypothetical protein
MNHSVILVVALDADVVDTVVGADVDVDIDVVGAAVLDGVDSVVDDAVVVALVRVHVHVHVAVVAADLPRVRWRPNIYLRRCSAGSVALILFFPSSPPLPTLTL